MEMRPFSPVDECLKLCGIGFCAYLAYRLGVKVGMMKPKSTMAMDVEYWSEHDEDND